MLWWSQLIELVCIMSMYALLLHSYRNQAAMEESFLCGILLCLSVGLNLEMLLMLPMVLWAFHMLWANNLRVYLAYLLGTLSVVVYAGIVYLLWPNSSLVRFVIESSLDGVQRVWCSTTPLWYIISVGVAGFFGLWALIAHLLNYSRANVRIQTRVLLTLPMWLVALLSCLFPTAKGNCLHAALMVCSLYLIGLYFATYGIPRIRLPKRKERRSKMNRRPRRWR